MEKNRTNIEKGNNPIAFLPEMVLEHINHTTPIESKKNNDSTKEEIASPTTQQTVIFDPMADPFDGSIIEIKSTLKKKKTKSIKTVDHSNLETPNLIIVENKIMQFVKKIKFNFFNF